MRPLVVPLVLLVLASAFGSRTARATDVQACLSASEKGQQARSAGRLREARERFVVCGGEGCPAIVRRDCTQWQADLVAMMPSVVFGAKDKQGRDLFDVVVTIDGEPVAKTLDGKAVPVDPGPHTFGFEIAGQPRVVERVLVKEGEKSRSITATFGELVGGAGGASGPSTTIGRDTEQPAGVRGHTLPPWIVVGVGGAAVITGIVVWVAAPAFPTNCDASSGKCKRTPGETDQAFAKDQDQAGKHDSYTAVGALIALSGVGVIGAGLLWHFLEPTGERSSTALRVSPWVGPGTSGVTLGGAFSTF